MDNFNEKIKYVNCTLDKIYEEISANTGKKAALEERISGGSGTRLVLWVLESGFVLGLIVFLLAAYVFRSQSGEILLKYSIFFLIGAGSIDVLSGKYRRARQNLALLQEREQILNNTLKVFLTQRDALLAGEEVQLLRFIPPEPIKEEKSRGGGAAVMLLIVAAILAKDNLTLPDLERKHQVDSVRLSEDLLKDTNDAGKVTEVENINSDSSKKSVDLSNDEGTTSTDKPAKHIKYEWEYNFTKWSQEMDIPAEIYEYFKNKNRKMISGDYLKYINETADDRLIQNMAENMTKKAAESGYNEREQIEMLIAFVQSLDYVKDKSATGEEIEYPKYPIETLYDEGGDCEDTCILLASLIRAKGYGVALIQMKNHMAVGVKCSEGFGAGSYYEVNGDKYYYVETTAKGWDIGAIPDEYKNMEAKVLVVD